MIATSNPGKLAEFALMLEPLGLELSSLGDLGLRPPAETADSFSGNARLKAIAASIATGMPALADDSGLCVDALDGRPGVRTAEFAERDGRRNYAAAMAELTGELQRRGARMPWTAFFDCAVAVACGNGDVAIASGRLLGQIVWPARGAQGHGYDAVFLPEGHTSTLAEMDPGQKCAISHRRLAVDRLIVQCFT